MQVSHSKLARFRLCPKSYEYHYEKKILPRLDSVYLVEGRIFHAALERYYTSGRDLREIAGLVEARAKSYLDEVRREEPDDVERIRCRLSVLWSVLRRYFEYASRADAGWSVQGTERRFSVPLGPHTHTGVIDLIANRDGKWWVWEHKYISWYEEDLVKTLDSQVGTYLLAAAEILGTPPEGVVYNVAHKPPFRRNKFERWSDAANRIKESVMSRSEKSLFSRTEIVRTSEELKYLVSDVLGVVEAIQSGGRRYRNIGSHCKNLCPYMRICGNDDPFLMAEKFVEVRDKDEFIDRVEI